MKSAAILLAAFALTGLPVAAEPRVLFNIEADAAKGALLDRTGSYSVAAKDSVVERDERFGACARLGESGIAVRDDGRMRFEGGMTLEAWVRFAGPPPEKGAMLAVKVGSFAFDLQKGKLNTAWMVFPTEEIFTTAPQQFKYYPVGGDTINGLMNVPVGRWTRLTASYDEALGVVTTLIDGIVDRRRYRYRGSERLQGDGKSPLMLLSGCKGARVAGIKLTSGPPDVLPPAMEAYLNPLPDRGQVMITLDHIDHRLPLPIEVAVVAEKPSGQASTLQTLTLDSHARRDVVFDASTWLNSLHTYTVSAAAGGRQFFSRSLRLANTKPAGRARIHEDLTLSRDGRRFFPLLMYHAMPEDYPRMAELGVNLVLNDFCLNRAHSGDAQGYTRDLTPRSSGMATTSRGATSRGCTRATTPSRCSTLTCPCSSCRTTIRGCRTPRPQRTSSRRTPIPCRMSPCARWWTRRFPHAAPWRTASPCGP